MVFPLYSVVRDTIRGPVGDVDNLTTIDATDPAGPFSRWASMLLLLSTAGGFTTT
ncbi:hypothetical protein LCGC14_1799720 [marine sediment metagenome]|uniref:Uncharacterized protein n=1 Tax=marine sediment metagenome TaxID=412755 RepID=A0A0F9GQ53_9ZZZZ